jgi:hypothetical protein
MSDVYKQRSIVQTVMQKLTDMGIPQPPPTTGVEPPTPASIAAAAKKIEATKTRAKR